MLAQPGEPESPADRPTWLTIVAPVTTGGRGPGEIDEDVAVAHHGEAEVETVAGDREQVAPHRQRGDVRDIVLRGAEIDRERAAVPGQEQLLRVVGVPVGDVLDDLRAVVDDIERHRAEVGRRRDPGVTVAVMVLPTVV